MLRRQFGCPGEKPCTWPDWVDTSCAVCAGTDPAIVQAIWLAVVEWVHEATLNAFGGICEVSLTACEDSCGCSTVFCGCHNYKTIDLKGLLCGGIATDPVTGWPLLEMRVGANNYNAQSGAWYWDQHEEAMKIPPGSVLWNLPSQDLYQPTPAWYIRVATGKEPPALLVRGARGLTCELIKEHQEIESCLADNIKAITRRGIDYETGDKLSDTIAFDLDKTGVPALDLALERWGVNAASSGAGLISPTWADQEGWAWRQIEPTTRNWAGGR